MTDVRRLVVENGNRVNELTQQAQRCVHLDREQMGLCGRKNLREPDAGNVIRHDHHARHGLPCPLHATHASEVFGLKICEPVRPIAQRRFDDG